MVTNVVYAKPLVDIDLLFPHPNASRLLIPRIYFWGVPVVRMKSLHNLNGLRRATASSK